jgi:hypothetical protein
MRWSLLLVVGVVIVAVLLVIANVATPPAAAQLAPRDQKDPNLTYLSARGEYLLVWSEDRGAGNRIYAKRIRANGFPLGGTNGGEWEATRFDTGVTVPPPAKGDQRWPAVIDSLLVYGERVPGGTDYDVYAQRLFANGRPAGTPMLIAGGPGDQKYPDVLAVGRGNLGSEYLIVWSEDTKDLGDVMGIRVDYALRRSRGPAFPIAQGPGTAEDPAICQDLLQKENYLVLYTDDRAGNKDIWGVRLTASGLPRGGPVGGPFAVIKSPQDDYAAEIVNSAQRIELGPTPTPDRTKPPTPGAKTPQKGHNLLIWTTDDVKDGPNIMGQRLSDNGLPEGKPFLVAGDPGKQAWPAAALYTFEGPNPLATSQPGEPHQRDEWFAVWNDDKLGTLDVLGVPIGINGLMREHPRVVASD